MKRLFDAVTLRHMAGCESLGSQPAGYGISTPVIQQFLVDSEGLSA